MYVNDLYLENNKELTLGINCGYIINQNEIQINIDQINNNRNADNISGSLSVELWALPEIYNGENILNSHCICSTTIGEIYGEHFLQNCQYNLNFDNPPAGSWNLCLMLKEYNGEYYETVDYCNFNVPYIVDEKANIDLITETKIDDKEEVNVDITCETKINLNSANKEQFSQIKGITGKLRTLIMANRPYKSVDDLIKLKGIGKKTLEKILEQCEI